MDIRRSNRTLFFMMIIIGVIGAIIISNVLFTMVTHKHFRSGVNIKEFKDADISNTQVIKANRGTIYDRNNEVIAQDEDTYTIVAYLDESRKGIGDVDAYVKDIRKTARLLANELGAEEESIIIPCRRQRIVENIRRSLESSAKISIMLRRKKLKACSFRELNLPRAYDAIIQMECLLPIW